MPLLDGEAETVRRVLADLEAPHPAFGLDARSQRLRVHPEEGLAEHQLFGQFLDFRLPLAPAAAHVHLLDDELLEAEVAGAQFHESPARAADDRQSDARPGPGEPGTLEARAGEHGHGRSVYSRQSSTSGSRY